MKATKSRRSEVIIAGLGGQGIVVAGDTLAHAAMRQFQYISGIPVYGGTKRDGLCEATVIFSDSRIASPFIDQAQAVVLFDNSYFKEYEPRVRAGGVMITEKMGLTQDRQRNDYKLYTIPALETAADMREMMAANMIMLGAYTVITGAIPVELIEAQISETYGSRPQVLARNLDAFRRGLQLGEAAES